MKLIKMDCDHCGASLELDLENMQANCPYCGSKLMIDPGKLSHILESVQETKREQIREEGKTKRTEIEYEYKNKVNKQSNFILKAFFAIMGIAFAVVIGMAIISFIRFSFS